MTTPSITVKIDLGATRAPKSYTRVRSYSVSDSGVLTFVDQYGDKHTYGRAVKFHVTEGK